MRREFIIVLLGIIFVSTLSSLLSDFVLIHHDKMLVDAVFGTIIAGNFTYWQLSHSGPLIIELLSLTGDADMYVSHEKSPPTYEIEGNSFSSATCGRDVVSIPSDYPRPIIIGIFGHWSYSVSDYAIQVYLDTTLMSAEEEADQMRSHKTERLLTNADGQEILTNNHVEVEKPRLIFRILDYIDMVLDMLNI